jgi:RNA polymerase sigma factor (sigma-70 family)
LGDEAELDALMDRLVDGDRSAFGPLYRALYPRALGLARRKLGAGSAEDVAQSALLRVFARAAEFERGRAVLPWFYAITANEVRGVLRRRAPMELSVEPTVENDPESDLCSRELGLALDQAIASLDDDSAEAIRALLDRGPRPPIEPATFRKRVSRAYARLRTLLGGIADV